MKGYRIFCIVFTAIVIFSYFVNLFDIDSIGGMAGCLIGLFCSIAVEVYLCLVKPK